MKDVKTMCICSMFSILIAVGAFIKIPISIVPITLQTLFVVLAGFLLGKKKASLSVFVYIVIGLVGIPVFVNGGGITYVLQPTFGYLIGFLISSYLIGMMSMKDQSSKSMLLISVFGMLIIYLIGMMYFAFIQYFYYGITFQMGWILYYLFIVYLPGDLISCIIAVFIAKRLLKIDMIQHIRN